MTATANHARACVKTHLFILKNEKVFLINIVAIARCAAREERFSRFNGFSKPAGIRQSQRDCITQPRVARHELPWVNRQINKQPQRGCSLLQSFRFDATPLGLKLFFNIFPRVARAWQPWANGLNPVGIRLQNPSRRREIIKLEITPFRNPEFLVPKGHDENSPAFQRRVLSEKERVPKGRLTGYKIKISFVPSGLICHSPAPDVETSGYSRKSLRDKNRILI